MGNKLAHFLKMSGMVPSAKRKEFEQTFRFVSNHLGPDCLQYTLAEDVFTPERYHFYSLWNSAEALNGFCNSQEFQVLEGAYKTLGVLENSIYGVSESHQ